MKVVLGIDAAWTLRNPSGVALAVNEGNAWRLVGAFPSYQDFLLRAGLASGSQQADAPVSAGDLIAATRSITDWAPDLVAMDLPMALTPIEGRRAADSAISRAYGARWCAAHSPSATRPGKISDDLRQEFAQQGFPLCIREIACPGLIEVYPHPALVELCAEPRRLPYKVAKAAQYWPGLTPDQRRAALLAEWDSIAPVLEGYVSGAEEALQRPLGLKGKALKAVEDMMDAVVCCIAGIRALEGFATAYAGDDTAAIWVPEADKLTLARTLLPSSPYSARAEMRVERSADRLQEGEYPDLFSPGKKHEI